MSMAFEHGRLRRPGRGCLPGGKAPRAETAQETRAEARPLYELDLKEFW
jgi:hypothetical protein